MHVDNENDARRIYCSSLIRIDGSPVVITDVRADLVLRGINIRTQELVRKDVNDAGIDNTPIPTGFVNGLGNSVYVTRRTSRLYSQGLTSENMCIRVPVERGSWAILQREVSNLNSVHLADMIDGIYPQYEESLAIIENDLVQISAFGRNKAVDYRGNVYYRAQIVGKANKDNGSIVMMKQFNHYKWVFEEKCE